MGKHAKELPVPVKEMLSSGAGTTADPSALPQDDMQRLLKCVSI
jgi:hypothetical protein